MVQLNPRSAARVSAPQSVLSLVEYGYDRVSNRTWRANPTDPAHQYDWLYSHDGLHRLETAQRGTAGWH